MKNTAHISRFLALIGLAITAAVGSADQKTVRLTPTSQPGGCSTLVAPGCGYASNLDPSKVVGGLLHDDLACLRFTDPTPPFSKVTSIDLRMGYAPRTTTPAVMEVHMHLGSGHGTFPENFVGSFNPSNVPVASHCAPPYNSLPLGIITGVEHEDGIRGFVYGGLNGLIFTDTMDLEFLDIIVNYTPPPKIDFDLTATTDEKQRRALIKRWRDDFPYFSTAQESLPASGPGRDGRIRIAGTVTDINGPVANQAVHLRVVDPPDEALYIPVASRVRGDNADGPGSLEQTTVNTDGNGRFETVLSVTGRASGDNYQIEATTVAKFGFKQTCDTFNNCYQSGVLTAWKRIHVEFDRMFQKGAMLTQDIPQCSATACSITVVAHVDDAGPITKAKRLRLIHAPRFDGRGSGTFYHEDVDVIRVNKRANTVEISRPLNSFYGPDELQPGTPIGYLADALGQITVPSGAPNDYFDVNREKIDDVMNVAFVDYVDLAGDPAPFVPYQDDVAGVGTVNDEITLLARKWFLRYGDENVQHLIGAKASDDPFVLGRTTSRIATNYAFIFVESLDSNSPKANQGSMEKLPLMRSVMSGRSTQLTPVDIARRGSTLRRACGVSCTVTTQTLAFVTARVQNSTTTSLPFTFYLPGRRIASISISAAAPSHSLSNE